MASAEKKVAELVVALMVIDIIIALISLEKAQVETSAIEPISLPERVLLLQDSQGAEEEYQLKEVQPEATSRLVEDTATKG